MLFTYTPNAAELILVHRETEKRRAEWRQTNQTKTQTQDEIDGNSLRNWRYDKANQPKHQTIIADLPFPAKR